eukprot:755379-Hanusia_phi.AAC.2
MTFLTPPGIRGWLEESAMFASLLDMVGSGLGGGRAEKMAGFTMPGDKRGRREGEKTQAGRQAGRQASTQTVRENTRYGQDSQIIAQLRGGR